MNELKCKSCRAAFIVTQDDIEAYARLSPHFGGHLLQLPIPQECPDCRLQKRLAFRNERSLYRKHSALSGQEILGMHAEDSPYQMVSMEEWLSDHFDGCNYAKPYDSARPFFQQFKELSLRVPHRALNYLNAENSAYTNFCLNVKDCYLSYGISDCELCLYSKTVTRSRQILDSLTLVGCECCYQGVSSEGCTRCFWFKECTHSSELYFCEACENCESCALCYGLYRKKYYVANRFVGAQGFADWLSQHKPFTLSTIARLVAALDDLKAPMPRRGTYLLQSENCSGDFVFQSKNCQHCFDTQNSEDSKFLFWTPQGISSYDCCFNSPEGVNECYQACSTLGMNCIATYMVWSCQNVFYSMECRQSHDLFGCIGLDRKQYCVLNQQLNQDDYHALAARLSTELQQHGQWGEYLPQELSLFAYNQTIAQEYFPLSKQQAIAAGWNWRDDAERAPAQAAEVSYDRCDWNPQVCSQVLRSRGNGRPYKIVPQELAFYREFGIALPDRTPDERHFARMQKRNPLRLWKRKCPESAAEFMSNYDPQGPEVVLDGQSFREFLISDRAVKMGEG